MQLPVWTIQEQSPNGYWVRGMGTRYYKSEESARKAALAYAQMHNVRAVQITKVGYDQERGRNTRQVIPITYAEVTNAKN